MLAVLLFCGNLRTQVRQPRLFIFTVLETLSKQSREARVKYVEDTSMLGGLAIKIECGHCGRARTRAVTSRCVVVTG